MSPVLGDAMTSLGWTLVHFVWQGAVVGFATALALTVLRNARPQLRYLAACCGLMACLLWPAAGLWQRLSGAASAGATDSTAMRLAAVVPAEGAASLLAYLQSNMTWLVLAWAACALALSLRMALGLLWVGHAARRTTIDPHWQANLNRLAERAGITRQVRLRIVATLASPVTAGWWRPVVLVPAALVSGMPAELLEALLAHEIAHVKRHDYLVNLVQNVVETLLFYHPAVWWISRRIRAEREQIADDFAASQLGEPRRLARALSELEKLQFAPHHLAQAATGGDLMVRIKRLVRPDTQTLGWKAAVPVLGLAALCAAVYAHEAPQPKHPAQGTYTRALADFRSCAKPVWPKEDLAAGHTGAVRLQYLVSADGRVVDSQVVRSSGHPGLDRAAQVGIAKCRFKPATLNGQPVQDWMKMMYVWTLE